MKIGIVLSQPPSYSETFFNSKIKGLLEQGFEVQLFVRDIASGYGDCALISAPKVSKNKVLQLLKTTLVFFSLLPHFTSVKTFIKLERSAKRSWSQILKNIYNNSHILKANLDWLHFGFTTMALQSEHVAKSICAKMAVSCRGYDMDVYPLKHPNCYQLVWQNVDKVHAISEYMLLRAHENGLPKTIKNVIIFPAIKKSILNDYYQKKQDLNQPFQMTTIARLHWIKGLNYTLEALSILKNRGIDFKYGILGSGPEYENLKFAIHQLGLTENVVLTGNVSHHRALNRIKETDIYIQYSQSEGFCNAVLEAQAIGCYCVVSDGGALPENVLDNKTGFVVPKRNPKVLAETIFRVLNTDELALKTIRDNARERVLTNLTIKNQIQSFIDFYE